MFAWFSVLHNIVFLGCGMALIWGCYYFWGSVFGDCINAGGCVSVRVCVIFGGIVLGGCVLVFEGVAVRQLVNTL